MTKVCDNFNDVHNNIILNETKDGIRVRCSKCGEINVLRIDPNGRMDNREYGRVFKADTLQPSDNLYYKLHPNKMSVC